MPLETVTVVVEIGTHTDSLPLNGPKLALAIAKAIEQDYPAGEHEGCEIIECESVSVDGDNWLPFLPCRNGDHEICRNQEPHVCPCVCHVRVVVEPQSSGEAQSGDARSAVGQSEPGNSK
jgi:hypothetical protein